MDDVTKKYGLSTTITMIIGICIGSGIFFKSDNILIATNGSIFLGALLFIIAAISIIFGCLTIGELAVRTDKVGGLISIFKSRNWLCFWLVSNINIFSCSSNRSILGYWCLYVYSI